MLKSLFQTRPSFIRVSSCLLLSRLQRCLLISLVAKKQDLRLVHTTQAVLLCRGFYSRTTGSHYRGVTHDKTLGHEESLMLRLGLQNTLPNEKTCEQLARPAPVSTSSTVTLPIYLRFGTKEQIKPD